MMVDNIFRDKKSESGIIGSCVESNIIAKRIFKELNENYFYGVRKILFLYCKASFNKHGKCSRNFIENAVSYKFNDSKGEKIKNVLNESYTFANKSDIESYIISVKNCYYRKRSNEIGSELIKKANDKSSDREDIDEVFEQFRGLRFNEDAEKRYYTSKEIKETSDESVKLETNDKVFNNIVYGHGGLDLGIMEIICMISGHGKTFYSMKKGASLAMAGHRGAIFYLEDRKIKASQRIDALIPPDKYPEENSNFLVVPRRRYLSDIISDIMTLIYNEGIKWFIIDHLGKGRHKKIYERNKVEREFAGQLSDLCIDENLLGHMNVQVPKGIRYGKSGWGKAPTIESVKGAGEIIEDAVVVTVGFRPNNVPELISQEVDGRKFVKLKNGQEVNYNSLFIRQVKNRRVNSRVMDWFPMIQIGKKLYWKSEAEKLGEKFNKSDIIKKDGDLESQIIESQNDKPKF